MARMSIRATYALDEQTDQRIKHLARTWQVSQAEVIRRSVQTAAEQSRGTLTPADVVARYAKGALPRNKQETRRVIQSLRAMRHADDKRRIAEAP
ncbi:MAG: ribbon-helix-helix domain-containing protein [Rhodanobacter sp.]